MDTKIIVVGQGISGTMLSWYLYKAGIPFVVMDEARENTASKVAAGIINPVTGRRIVTTWMIETLMPFAVQAYQEFGLHFNLSTITQKQILDFFPTKQMQEAFAERVQEKAPYLHILHQEDFTKLLHYYLGYGIIEPSYIVQVQSILATWRSFLKEKSWLIETPFIENHLTIANALLHYEHIAFSKLIFANGEACSTNLWFKSLPWAANKGEALLIECTGLPTTFIYKKGLTIAPIGKHLFWVGANYNWTYTDANPTEKFYTETKQQLEQLLKVPFTILDHKAGIRPANIERRPFVGFHPIQTNIGLLNGMGAKGTSLAPYFAYQLVQHISKGSIISPEADVRRFTKILSRN